MTPSIFVPLDGSPLAEQSLPHAARLAELLGASLLLARVPETMIVPVMSAGIWITQEIEPAEAHEHAEAYLAGVARRPELAGHTVQTLLPGHPVADGLLRAVEMTHPRLVVMTTHGRSGLGRWVLGSIADKIVHAAPVPVYVVRATDAPATAAPPGFKRILVPLDGSPAAEAALDEATALARATGGALVLVRVPTVPGYATVIPETAGWIPQLLRDKAVEAAAYLGALAERLRGDGLDVTTDVEIVAVGTVAEGILAAAADHEADLVVMSTHGRTGFRRWMLGSVADGVLHHTGVPLWLVRSTP